MFKRIFGAEARKPLLIALLNHMLELDGERRILDVQHLSADQHVGVPELKLSIVDVQCTDATGRRFFRRSTSERIAVQDLRRAITERARGRSVREHQEATSRAPGEGTTSCRGKLWCAPRAVSARSQRV